MFVQNMMEATVSRHNIAKIGNRDRWRNAPDRNLAAAMKKIWLKAEAMAFDFADEKIMGKGNTIHISRRTASNWQNGVTGPGYAEGNAIREAIIKKSEQQIQDARARIERLKKV